MSDFKILSMDVSPLVLALYAIIGVGALLAFRILGRQWKRRDIGRGARSRDTAALAIIALASLALVSYGDGYLRARAEADAQVLDQLEEKTALARQLRERIARELDAARILLANRTVEKIANQELVEARAELARFAAFQDPKINRMIELINAELEIRKLVKQSLAETDPGALGVIYARLTVLAPTNGEYRDKAAQYAASPGGAADAAAQPPPAAAKPFSKP